MGTVPLLHFAIICHQQEARWRRVGRSSPKNVPIICHHQEPPSGAAYFFALLFAASVPMAREQAAKSPIRPKMMATISSFENEKVAKLVSTLIRTQANTNQCKCSHSIRLIMLHSMAIFLNRVVFHADGIDHTAF